MTQSFAFVFPDALDLTSVADIQVSHGYILTLPFRVRTGKLFVLHVGDSFDLIFRNRIDIPPGTSTDELQKLMWQDKQFRPREQFYTEVIILDKKLPVPAGFRDAFSSYFSDPSAGDMPVVEARYFKAFSSLNDAIVGYHHATNSLFGGALDRTARG